MDKVDREEEARLRERVLRRFIAALHTDRTVAFTGSMSTEALGYPSWDEFIVAYALIARDWAGEILELRRPAPGEPDPSPTGKLLGHIRQTAMSIIIDTLKPDLPADAFKPLKIDPRVAITPLRDLFTEVDARMRDLGAGSWSRARSSPWR